MSLLPQADWVGPDDRRRAIFSPCRTYRYALFRNWGPADPCMFIGLNPSTADETRDDPTVRRCINYAKRWGWGGLIMANIFAYRSTDPEVMKLHPDPVGPENDAYLKTLACRAGVIVAAWGNHGAYMGRGEQVKSMLHGLQCLSVTKEGQPGHPLYLRSEARPRRWA